MPQPNRLKAPTAIDNGNRIIKALLGDADQPIRLINLHGFQAVTTGVAVTILVLATITRPHLIVSFQPICSLAPGQDVAVDILLSNNTLTDTGAEVRDRHISGGRLIANGWNASSFASPWPINILNASRFTVYKLAMRNLSSGTVTFDTNLTLKLL